MKRKKWSKKNCAKRHESLYLTQKATQIINFYMYCMGKMLTMVSSNYLSFNVLQTSVNDIQLNIILIEIMKS